MADWPAVSLPDLSVKEAAFFNFLQAQFKIKYWFAMCKSESAQERRSGQGLVFQL